MRFRDNIARLDKDFQDKYLFTRIAGKIHYKKIIAFDIETHDNNQKFTLASAYDGERYYEFFGEQGKKEIKKFLVDKKHQSTFICATNLQFDFSAMEDSDNFFRYKIIQKGARFICVKKSDKYKNKNHKGHDVVFSNIFIDSINLFPMSVEKAGKVIGIPKMDKPATLGLKPRQDVTATAINDKGETYKIEGKSEFEYLLEYNKQDTYVTYKLMEFLNESFNILGCEMKMTISSTAMDLFRRKYLPCDMIKEEYIMSDDAVKQKIFKCYYGGRTEVFGRGYLKSDENNKWVVGDFNSKYPDVMRNKFPLPQSIRKPEIYSVDNIREYEGFSDVSIECDYMFYPLLPFKDDDNGGKLIFPIGRWRASYTHVELRKAIKIGYRILDIHEQHIYTETFYPFKEYVSDLYAKRLQYQAENNPMEQVVKLAGNCFSEDTRILTESGLKYVKDIQINEKVYSVNPITLKTEIKNVIRTYDYYYDGVMYHICNPRMDCLVTPNHKFLIRSLLKYDSYEFIEANKIVGNFIPKTEFNKNIYIFDTDVTLIKNPSNKVYCVEVADNHTVIAERNGKMLVTGQSTYGKFGEKEHTEIEWFNVKYMTTFEYRMFLEMDNTMMYGDKGYIINTKECTANHVFPIICAYVTSYARLDLYDAIVKYNAVFCDTDSVITNKHIISSKELGGLKIEDELKEVIIVKPKLYMKVTSKGVTKVKFKGLPNAKIEQFESILQHEKVFYNKFTKPSESIRKGIPINSIREESKSINLEDNKRAWKKPFSDKTFDFDSSPIKIDKLQLRLKKHIRKKTMKEKIEIANKKRNKAIRNKKDDITDDVIIKNIMQAEEVVIEEDKDDEDEEIFADE
jgi:hypothetical protein